MTDIPDRKIPDRKFPKDKRFPAENSRKTERFAAENHQQKKKKKKKNNSALAYTGTIEKLGSDKHNILCSIDLELPAVLSATM